MQTKDLLGILLQNGGTLPQPKNLIHDEIPKKLNNLPGAELLSAQLLGRKGRGDFSTSQEAFNHLITS